MVDTGDFESRILAFERASQQETAPAIANYLPESDLQDGRERHRLLVELICVDLEYRWKAAANSQEEANRVLLDDYVRLWPELKSLDNIPVELIGEEYRVRHIYGDHPTHHEFLARFKLRLAEIGRLIGSIDEELRNEGRTPPPEPIAPKPSPPRSAPSYDPRAPLSDRDYLLQRLIGAGRMGKVYRARQLSLDRPVAIKYLRKSFLQHEAIVERFVSEAKTVAQLRHPGVVGVHGLGRTPIGGYFIVMDLVEGPDLARIISTDGPCAFADIINWMIQACDAVDHAQQRGIIHCDLKPGNLLLDQDGRLRVTDFGLAHSIVDNSQIGDCIEGTAPFMAPEQITSYWGAISPRTDVYGLGSVLYALLTGRAPWDGATLADVLARVISAEAIINPTSIRPETPSKLAAVCLRCLSRSPKERFASALELRAALSAITDLHSS